MMDIGANSLTIPSGLPSFMYWTSYALVRLPVAVLVLASCKLMPTHGLAVFSPWSRYMPLPVTSTIGSCRVCDSIIGIPPDKPCRRRQPFSPRMRVNRFVFLNLPMLQPWRPSWRNGFASAPLTCGLRHPASWRQVTAAWAHAPHSREQGIRSSSFLLSIPDTRARGARK